MPKSGAWLLLREFVSSKCTEFTKFRDGPLIRRNSVLSAISPYFGFALSDL